MINELSLCDQKQMLMNRKKVYGLILLASILPLISISSLHIHHAEESVECVDCARHLPHGHVGGSLHAGECCFCHFLSLSWMPQELTAQTVFSPASLSTFFFFQFVIFLMAVGGADNRAPPFSVDI